MKYYKFTMQAVLALVSLALITSVLLILNVFSLNPYIAVPLIHFFNNYIPAILFFICPSIILYSLYIRFIKKDTIRANLLFYYPLILMIGILFLWIVINYNPTNFNEEGRPVTKEIQIKVAI